MRGAFISLEGGEGSGKSTQSAILAERLRKEGAEAVSLREPGGTRVGDEVRSLLLDPSHATMDHVTELLLYEASRAQLVSERIEPALEAGAVVLCDRFTDSTLAYQAFARGLDREVVERLNALASKGIRPDLTVVFDIDPALGLQRATGKGPDRLEAEEIDFHERVREGFLAVAREEPERVVVLDAEGTREEIAERLWEVLLASVPVRRVLGAKA